MMSSILPSFSAEFIHTPRGAFYIRRHGNGTPLLLLHGFPQSHACWSEIAPALTEHHDVICMDLLGYGLSDAPPGDVGHLRYSKQKMALDCLAVMDQLGIASFSVAGHDRGALVACRLAQDHPLRIKKLVVMDNLPTFMLWDRINIDPDFIPHWRNMAKADSEDRVTPAWLEQLMREHTASGDLEGFPIDALTQYRQSWRQPERIHAFAEDYRAGAGPDVALDRHDYELGRHITAPTLIVWGEAFLGAADEAPVDSWRRTLIPNAEGVEVPGGHFNAEEAPQETLAALNNFLH